MALQTSKEIGKTPVVWSFEAVQGLQDADFWNMGLENRLFR
jgi:hypothetical protein